MHGREGLTRWFAARSREFRARRMREFCRVLEITPGTKVLDVGGTREIWDLSPVIPKLTFLNQPRARAEMDTSLMTVFGDAQRLPFRDNSFDVVFSNSVIEHVGSLPDQQQFAAEVARVGKRYWIQTPDRRFPIETHLNTPLIHLLPTSWQAVLLPRCTVWAWMAHPGPAEKAWYLNHFLAEIRLLTSTDLKALFPDAEIIRERFCGLSKSLIATRR